MPKKKEKNPDQNPSKEKGPVEEPGTQEGDMVLKQQEDDFVSDLDLDDADDFEMADMYSIRDIVSLDPNDIEFRQRHAEEDMDIAA